MSDLHWSTDADFPILSLAASAALGLAASIAAAWWVSRAHPADMQPTGGSPAVRTRRTSRPGTNVPHVAHPQAAPATRPPSPPHNPRRTNP